MLYLQYHRRGGISSFFGGQQLIWGLTCLCHTSLKKVENLLKFYFLLMQRQQLEVYAEYLIDCRKKVDRVAQSV